MCKFILDIYSIFTSQKINQPAKEKIKRTEETRKVLIDILSKNKEISSIGGIGIDWKEVQELHGIYAFEYQNLLIKKIKFLTSNRKLFVIQPIEQKEYLFYKREKGKSIKEQKKDIRQIIDKIKKGYYDHFFDV